jgi:hypothetical protein
MSAPNPDKLFFIQAYFDDLSTRIENLKKLSSGQIEGQSFRDEALILCLVYIDGLASNYYGEDGIKESFCKALRELSGNPLFGKLHVRRLLDPENDPHWEGAKDGVEKLASENPGELLDETDVANSIRKSGVLEHVQEKLIKNLWRYSIAAICYEMMRNAAVHGLGASTLSFDETIYEGTRGVRLTFTVLHQALVQIAQHISQESIRTGEWFGRKNYFKTR